MYPDSLPGPSPLPVDAAALAVSKRPSNRHRIVALGQVLLCSDVPTQFAIGLALALVGWLPTDATGALSLRYVVALSLADVALLLLLILACLRATGESPRELWLGRRSVVHEALLGLLLVPGIFIALAIVLSSVRFLAPGLQNVPDNPLEQLAQTPLQAAAFGLAVVLAGGLREELQRAFLLRRFEQSLGGRWVGLIVVSVAFGLGHALQGWDAVVATGTLGALWGVMYLRRRSSVAAVVSHAAFNAIQVILAMTARNLPTP